MTKQEVLEKAQKKKPNQMDEMEFDILLKSNRIGLLAGIIVCMILMFIKMYLKLPYQDIYSIICFILSAQLLYKWHRQKDKNMLFCGVILGIAALLLFTGYLITIM